MDPGSSSPDLGLPGLQPSSDTLEIHLPRHRISWQSRLLSFAVVGLLCYLALQALRIRFDNRTLFSWWNSNEGGRYSKYMSLFMLLTFFQGSLLLYWLISAVHPPVFQLTKSNYGFLSGTLLSYIRLPSLKDPTQQMGILTPKQLCQTVLLHSGDGDQLFDAWYQDPNNARLQGDVANDPDFALTFHQLSEDLPILDYTGHCLPLKGHEAMYGVYPKAKDTNSWRGCIQAWANGGLHSKRAPYKWYLDADSRFYFLAPDPSAGFDKDKDPLLWFNNQPDNFLGRYGIQIDSPLVTFFVTGKAYLKNIPVSQVNAESLDHLIGEDFSDVTPGGWLGFMYGKGPDTSADDFYNELFTSVDAQKAPPSDPRTCDAVKKGLAGAGLAALSAAPMVAPLMLTGPGIVIGLFCLAAAAVAGGIDKSSCPDSGNSPSSDA
jgi:hypothetical protein